jgi:TM2 domain-containing membrane protein YozV
MNYYIGDGGQQRGPFTIEQLRGMQLSPDTLVWREGMPQWQPARLVPELQLIAATPPMAYATAQPYTPGDSKKILAGLMGIFFGWLGVHKFILGFTGAGLVYLLVTVCTCGIAYPLMHILSIIEGIVYLSKSDEEFHRAYVVERRSWF